MDLITSIPRVLERRDFNGADVGVEYFSRCVDSWKKHGFAIRTLNRENEVELIRQRFKLEPTLFADNNDLIFADRFGPSFGEIYKYLNHNNPSCIVNADVYVLPSSGLVDQLAELSKNAFLFASRTEILTWPGPLHSIYARGIDFVAFRPDKILGVLKDPVFAEFKLGLYWWDYVLPIAASFFMPVLKIREPFILHYVHRADFDSDLYNKMLLKSFEVLDRLSKKARLSNPAAADFAKRIDGLDVTTKAGRSTFAELCINWMGGKVGPISEIKLTLDLELDALVEMLRTTLVELTTAREVITFQVKLIRRLEARPQANLKSPAERWAEWWLCLNYNWDLKVFRGLSPVTAGEKGAFRITNPRRLLFQTQPRIEALRVGDWLRFGNSVKQLVNTLYAAERLDIPAVYFAEPHEFFAGERAGDLRLVWENSPAPQVPCLEGTFFHLKALRLKPKVRDISRIFAKLIRPLVRSEIREPDPRVGEDDLILHFRSGDAFGGPELAFNHGQPPLSYYLSAVEREAPRRIWLVFEDRGNPCIDAAEAELKSRGMEVLVQSGSLAEDLRLLMSARRIVAGRGSFVYWTAHLSDRLRRVYFFHKASRMQSLCELGIEVFVAEDIDGEFSANLLSGNWIGSPDQYALMLTYPREKLRFSAVKGKQG